MGNKWAYYNEFDPYAAQWLRNLIVAGHIAPGVVDERSISDVKPAEIQEFRQCHFFAGIGVWSYALRAAGWNDDRPVWTGSCPCQPFSVAGKGDGFSDERHLWPHWFHLIQMCRPVEIFGEQVASKDGLAWLDLVQTDLEEAGYTNAALDLCAAGFGAPHIRQRLWLYAKRKLGYSERQGLERYGGNELHEEGRKTTLRPSFETGIFNSLADSDNNRQQSSSRRGRCKDSQKKKHDIGRCSKVNSPSDAKSERIQSGACSAKQAGRENSESNMPVNGFWSEVEWIYCKDDKFRPIEPGSSPLVNVSAAGMVPELTNAASDRNHPKVRKVALKGYGNAIVSEVAKEFIKAAMQYRP
ncbi:TPA: DNA cytosine methyltransferase [Vibrio parahaemolyticus]|nr:DNA cytosine methyltransferase [Vibrio parahaemolyticus]